MKKFLIQSLAALCFSSIYAQENIITLDLANATTNLEFNENTGAWVGTYDDEAQCIESQCFSFVHSSISDWNTWWGFTASNSADNSWRSNFVTYQFSNMAEGGIVLAEDGTVKKDDFGAPVVSAEMPYLVAFYSPFMSQRPVDMAFNTDNRYEAVGVYVNLNSYAYYTVQDGDNFARAFTNGDRLTLTVHGVDSYGDEKEVEVDLAAYTNGNLTLNRGWRYVDLSSLGEINELYFTLKSTDSGAYGDNTPAYFCLDKLMVRELTNNSLYGVGIQSARISYDRVSKTVSFNGAEFAAVYDATGRIVMSSESCSFGISHLPAGVYVVCAGDTYIKIAK